MNSDGPIFAIMAKVGFGGFGRRGLEAVVACAVLAVTVAILAGSLMVVEGARSALLRAARDERVDIVQVKGRFNRALFETPRTGYLQPLTLPVYDPLIEPEELAGPASGASVIARRSFLRNVVNGNSFLNLYLFGIDPDKERQVSNLSVARGRFLRRDDGAVTVIDQATARALSVDLGGTFPIRKADGEDMVLTVVGILDKVVLRDPPPRTVEAPVLTPDSSFVSSGAFVTLPTSEEIFARPTLTDALVAAQKPDDVPSLVDRLREAFRLEPSVFVTERYSQFLRKVSDFKLMLALFTVVGGATTILAGSFVANLLHDVYADRRRQYATLFALGFSPARSALLGLGLGMTVALSGAILGSLAALAFAPARFAMPSLMADLGTITPTFDLAVAGVVAGVAIASVAVGMAPTAWQLFRHSVAAALLDHSR